MKRQFKNLLTGLTVILILALILGAFIGIVSLTLNYPIIGFPLLIIVLAWMIGSYIDNMSGGDGTY